MSVNKVILVGTLGRDPESRVLGDGSSVSNISVATNEKFKDKSSGVMKETTEWHRVSFFGKLADIANQYLKKGSLVYIEGKIQTKKFQDKDGKDSYSTSIVASAMQTLGGKHKDDSDEFETEAPKQKTRKQSTPASNSGFDDVNDDLPF